MSTSRSNFSMQVPKLPEGTVVASYKSYEEARAAVDALARHEGFSVGQISIVGSDLKSVERVTGRMSASRAALSGLMTGIMLGLFFTMMWLFVDPAANFGSLLGILLLAVAFGVIWSLIAYLLMPNKREFTSMMQLTASRFDLTVPNELAADAARILGTAYLVGADQFGAGDTVTTRYPDAMTTQGHQSGVRQSGEPQTNGTPYGNVDQRGVPGEPNPNTGAGQSSTEDAAAAPEAPQHPPRTYGEMQDELRRKQREQGQSEQ